MRSERPLGLADAVSLGVVVVALGSALRAWLFFTTRDALAGLSPHETLELFVTGGRLDAVIGGFLVLAMLLSLLLPVRAALVARRLGLASVVAIAALLPAELAFFRYFGFRPNFLVLEHGADLEVWGAIARHPLTPGLGVAVLASGGLTALAFRWMALAISRSRPASWLSGPLRRGACGVMLTALAAIAARGTLDHRPISPSAAAISTNRVANEIAGSGLYTVIYELWRRARGDVVRLAEVQPTLPAAEAQARVRRMREARAPLPTAPLGIRNVVVVVMESMTGRLVGALEGQPALTPELDVLAAEGLLLTHCYATGERTVQGLEAVLASFPPLPGVSVIRRPEAQSGFATLGSVMEQHGYDTLFLYGGQGIFDHMRSFFLGNGFTRFIEERDFDAPAFRTSWGVSDNDLFRRANREFQARWQSGRPFLAAILTVSLHSPWERPPGFASHLPEDAEVPEGFEREELESFLYADHAIGEFVREARRLDYFYDTLFVFVGDHGVHLRGRALVPSEEYRVPALFLAPGRLAPGRIDEVTSQLDLAPTILGMLGLPPDPHFFGRDLRSTASESGLAVLVYRKQHYAARRGRRLTVLWEGGRRAAYRLESEATLVPAELDATHRADADDALAMLQTAEARLAAAARDAVTIAAHP